MAKDRVYLDHNATTPPKPAVVEAMARALGVIGNPSSVHAEGRAARALVEAAREQVAGLVGARPAAVIFTSGGTEAANAVLACAADPRRAGAPGRVLALATEHVCVLQGTRHAPDRLELIPVDADGVADLAWLETRLTRLAGETPLVSIQAANNETGVIQPVTAAAALVRHAGGLVHSDAVQAAGKLPIDIATLGADVLTLTAHKLGGPQGVGAIVLADGAVELDGGLIRGGGQERGMRAGTENVPAIAGFGVAAELAHRNLADTAAGLRNLRDRLEEQVSAVAPAAVFFGGRVERLPNTSAFAVPGLDAATLLMRLDLDGIAVSSGSACSSGKVKRSHVLAAMNVAPALAAGALRVSFGWNSTEADLARFVAAFATAVEALHRGRTRRAAA